MKKKKLLIIALIFAIVFCSLGVTYGRYVTSSIKNLIFETNNFFFSSDKLVEGGIDYEINNWGGADNIQIQFELNNHKNNLLTSKGNINYNLSVTCDTGITCNLSATSGTIAEADKTNNFSLTIVPNQVFNDEESVEVTVSATSTSPYVKTLSATYKIKVGKRGVSYQITDEEYQPYLLVSITNALETYKVRKKFGSYKVNTEISAATYNSLSETNKKRCSSAIIQLTWNPQDVIIDTTSSIIDSSTATSTTSYNGINYISSITFPVDIVSSTEVRFYKQNASNDYSYTGEGTPIITFAAS